MQKGLFFSLFGSIIFYGFVREIASTNYNNPREIAVYIGVVLVVGFLISELGEFVIKKSKKHYLSLLRDLSFVGIFGFIGTFIVLDLSTLPGIVAIILLAGGIYCLNARFTKAD